MAVTSYMKFGSKVVPSLQQKMSFADLENDVDRGGTGKPLSAEAGKKLKQAIADEAVSRIEAINNLKTNDLKKLKDAIDKETADRVQALKDEATARDEATDELKTTLSGELKTVKSDVNARVDSLENSLNSEVDTRKKSFETVKGLIGSNNSASIERDNALELRVSNIESGVSAGVSFQGAVGTLEELANLNEDEVKNGWAYRVKNGTNGSDIYVIIGTVDGDYKPDSWNSRSLMHLMDASDVTNAVSSERQSRQADIATLKSTLETKAGLIEDSVNELSTVLENEVSERKTAIENERNRRVEEDEKLKKAIDTNVAKLEEKISAVDGKIVGSSVDLVKRVDTLEADESVAGSVKNGIKQSKDFTNDWILRPMIEGQNNELVVSGKKIVVSNNIADGAMGVFQVVVYGGEQDSEAILVNVASINNNEIVLVEDNANEHDGKNALVRYFYRNAEQGEKGAGEGGAGEGGAGA